MPADYLIYISAYISYYFFKKFFMRVDITAHPKTCFL